MQERHIKFQDPITSFGLNAKFSGPIAAARYRGFDKVSSVNGLSFNIDHTLTGEIFTNQNQTLSDPKGVWTSKQGVTIKEDAPIPITLITNAGNADRIDLLVGKHIHDTVVAGGIAASYAIVQGIPGAGEPPITIDPEETVILGRFYIPANASSMTVITYTPLRSPTLGGKIPMLLEEDNRATGQQQDNQASNLTVISADYELSARGVILVLDKGNTFKAEDGLAYLDLLPNKPNGTEVNIYFPKGIKLRNFIEQMVDPINGNSIRAGYTAGLRGILISTSIGAEIDVLPQRVIKLVKVESNGVYNNVAGPNQNYVWGDFWQLVSISDSPEKIKNLATTQTQQGTTITQLQTSVQNLTNIINNINPPRSYKWIDYQGNFTDDFDAAGLAKTTSPYYGYGLCDGQGGRPNMSGRFMVNYDAAQSEFSSVGFVGGLKRVLLTISNIVSFRIPILVRWSNNSEWRTSSGSGRPITAVGGAGNGSDPTLGGFTDYIGGGQDHENLPPYRVGLCLMWVGISV